MRISLNPSGFVRTSDGNGAFSDRCSGTGGMQAKARHDRAKLTGLHAGEQNILVETTICFYSAKSMFEK